MERQTGDLFRSLRHPAWRIPWLALWCLALPLNSTAWSAEGAAAYDTPEAAQADPDFAVQGEYVGDNLGVQVVALGAGQFSVVTYRGGLPGAGWNGVEKQVDDADREDVLELVAALKRIERASPTLGAGPPRRGTMLFDGSPASLSDHWQPGARATADGLLQQGCSSIDTFGDFTLHLEFRLPYMPQARDQARANSGVYFQGRYETQVLDSFGLEGKDNECGAIYSVRAPSVNMCLPPLVWQTYDVDFTAARFNEQDGSKISNARLTLRLNGVLVQQDVEVPGPTRAAPLEESAAPGPIYLQDHGAAVRYRNIWVAPRDATREARRPIVPGFERFLATAGADPIVAGRLLAGEMNCTACHAADAELAARLPARPGPVLDQVGARARPEFLLKFIADPSGVKPGATMPNLLAALPAAERDAAALAIVNFLHTTGQVQEQPGNRQFAQNGERLFHQVGCVACHAPRNGTPVPAGTSVPLPDLSEKYSIPSLAQFLKDPHAARPSGRMPGLNLNDDEARDLACYLVGDVALRPRQPNMRFAAYEGSWNELPDFSQLKPYATGESAGLDLNVAERTSNFGVRFEGYLRIEREGQYTFHLGSDDGSLLRLDGDKLVDVDGVHPHQEKSASRALKQGMHSIQVDYMQGGGEWTLDLQYEGPDLPRQSADLAMSVTETPPPPPPPAPEDASRFAFDASQVDKGRELFASLGCAACHQLKQDDQPIKSTLAARPLRQCDPVRGCLADAPGKGLPDYCLGGAQRDALATLLSLAAVDAAPPTPDERIAQTMTSFNCYACHARGGIGGPESERNPLFITTIPEMGDEARVPPPLDGVGDKLQDGWLRHILTEGGKDRPYMLTRMPRFGPEVARLAEDLIAIDQRTEAPPPQLTESELRVKSTGRQLVGDKALACVKCHTFGEHKATGVQAMNLQTMARRIRQDWFQRYLPNPPRYRPGTRMPSGYLNGRGTVTGIYDGNQDQQVAAIWTYLADGDKAGLPEGLIADVIELKPDTRPIVYRNFIDFFDGGSSRGIAVGYPEKAHLTWDANLLCLAQVWHGRFIDASKHWVGRGPGFQVPLGDHIARMETTMPLAALESLDTPWPAEPPKDRGYRFRGYRLDKEGRPTFLYDGPEYWVEDAPLPIAKGSEGYFERRLTLRAKQPTQGLWFRAGAGEIKALEDGQYLVGGVLKIRVRGGGAPVVRQQGDRQELLVPVEFQQGQAEIVQEIVW